MRKVFAVLLIAFLLMCSMAGLVLAVDEGTAQAGGTQDTASPTVEATQQPAEQETSAGSGPVDYTKDPTPQIKPTSIEEGTNWLMGIGYRILGSITNISFIIFAIVIVLGAIVMVLPSLHHHPVMKYTGLSMIVGALFGYFIVLTYPLWLGIIKGTVSTMP